MLPHSSTLVKRVGVIIVPQFDWSDLLVALSTECEEIINDTETMFKYPSVEGSYTNVKEHLDANGKRFKTDILQKDDLSSGLKLFCKLKKQQKFNSYDGLVLTSLDESDSSVPTVSRQKRLSSVKAQAETSYLFGVHCAAFFSDISFLNITSAEQSYANLTINSSASSFECDDTSVNKKAR